MLYNLMRHCRNYFYIPGAAVSGTFRIAGGAIDLPAILPDQYYEISGSVFNDGLHRMGSDVLMDEEFTGTVRPMAVPMAFIDLSERIAAFKAISGEPSPLASESFGGYSYTRASGRNGGQLTWQQAFADDIEAWRKI